MLRVLDSFGTEPEFNHAHYAQSKGHKTPWGKWNLNPQQFNTMFRKSAGRQHTLLAKVHLSTVTKGLVSFSSFSFKKTKTGHLAQVWPVCRISKTVYVMKKQHRELCQLICPLSQQVNNAKRSLILPKHKIIQVCCAGLPRITHDSHRFHHLNKFPALLWK